jgi:signal transduction histidine kinase
MDLEVDPTLPSLKIDKGKITQALINIVTNGLYAMEGGGRLAIQAEIDRRDWVKVTVSDTGKGIPKEEIEKVFDYSYTTREKGLGLGLPIAHKVIEEHGGKITIESQVRKGTTISIYLPVGGP